MKKVKYALKIAAILSVVFFLFSCNNRVGDDKTQSLLVLTKLVGKTAGGDDADFLESDVIKIDPTLGPYVTADVIGAILEVKLKNPKPPSVLGISQYNNVTLSRYTVNYTLPTGGDAGIAAFDGNLSTLIEVDSSVTLNIVLVRAEAKQVAPLLGLAAALQVNATLTFYGQDMAGNPVQATGSMTIYFANYFDE